MMEPILKVSHLTTKFKLREGIFPVVNDLSFELHPGKTLALVGESGCGKSMTAFSLMQILPRPPALHPEGEVLYKGKNLLTFSDREMRKIRGVNMAMIFQDPMSALNPVYTIGNQLMEVLITHLHLEEEEAEERVIKALEEVGIHLARERMDAYPHQLSGGMKQRVMIAMALLCAPDILIADEPTTALDATIQLQVLDLMQDLQKKNGMAILLITHNMGVVHKMADEMVVMYATRGIEKGTKQEVFHHMAHPYTQGLFQSLPSTQLPRSRLPVIKGSVPPIQQLPSGCPFHPRCPHAMDICKQGEVPLFMLDHNHTTHCWLYENRTTN